MPDTPQGPAARRCPICHVRLCGIAKVLVVLYAVQFVALGAVIGHVI